MEIFVPGRLCLLGEHTDWASGYRHAEGNSCLAYGLCLVCATNEGLYARVTSLTDSTQITYKRLSPAGDVADEMSWSWVDTTSLRASANNGDFLAYVAGSILSFISYLEREHPDVDRTALPGVEIVNYKTTLPMKRGLSSSASVCTMIVRSLAFHLSKDLSLDEIMAIAYQGERNTPSQCGMMDFCVAMGPNRVGLMIMNGSSCQLKVIPIAQPLYFVVANLNAGKNTVKILRDLNSAFPFPLTRQACLLHEYVSLSQSLCWRAVRAISLGNLSTLANTMNDAQSAFDESAMSVCREELTSPKLHSVMSYLLSDSTDSKELGALAVKGVGSQGDGSVQVLCKDSASQQAVLSVLRDKFSCDGFVLTLQPSDTSLKETGSSDSLANLDIPELHVHEITVGVLVLPQPMMEVLTDQLSVNRALMAFLIDAIGCGIRRMIILNPETNANNHNNGNRNDLYTLMTSLSGGMQALPDDHYDLLSDANQKQSEEWKGYEEYIQNRLRKYCRLVHIPSSNESSHQKKRAKVQEKEEEGETNGDALVPTLSSDAKAVLREVQASLQAQADALSMGDTNYCAEQKVLLCRWRAVSDASVPVTTPTTKSSTCFYDGSHSSYGSDVSMFELIKRERDGVNAGAVIQFGEGDIACAQICEWDGLLK